MYKRMAKASDRELKDFLEQLVAMQIDKSRMRLLRAWWDAACARLAMFSCFAAGFRIIRWTAYRGSECWVASLGLETWRSRRRR